MPDRATALAAAVLDFRRDRAEFLPAELFHEPAWDLLLSLFVADAKGHRITARDVCNRTGATPAVMARWLQHLSRKGLVLGDGSGDLDDLLTLSPDALHSIEQAMIRLRELQERVEIQASDGPTGHRSTPA